MTKQVVKAVTMPAGGGESRQPELEDVFTYTPEHAIAPPLDLDQLAKLTTINRQRRSCIAAIVGNTVGLGFELDVVEGEEEEVDEDEAKALRRRLDDLSRKDRIRHRPDFTTQLGMVSWDRWEVGNGYLEVSRNRITGEIDGLYHTPGKRARRRQDRDGWVVGPRGAMATQRVEFYNFGEKVAYDADGKPTGRLDSRGMRWDRNELIPFQLYTSESRDYGLPPDTQLAVDYLGDKLAAEANAGFFDNSGVPPSVIFVRQEVRTGPDGEEIETEIDPSVVTAVADTLRSSSGKRRRVAVVSLPPGAQADKEDLAVLSERDMGFVSYRTDNRRATLGAFRLSPIFVADIEDAGKYTAQVERAITKEQVFDPEQVDMASTLNATLMRELSAGKLAIRFREIAIQEDEARRTSANDLADRSAITYGEYRAAHKEPPLREAEEGQDPQVGEVPHGWGSELMPPRQGFGALESSEQIEKADAEDELREDFEASVEDAIRRVNEIVSPGGELATVVVEKDGDRITVHPYGSANGSG